jgi:ferritin-like metal-binding protein YciE
MAIEGLEDLLHDELKDIYDAEKQLTKALPKLVKKASAPELKDALQAHLGETEGHIDRLKQVFEQLGLPLRGKKCEGMQHLLAEGNEMIADAEDDATRDAVLIAGAQKVEHYEIASYGTIRTWANLLGKTDVAALMEDTLEEEKDADLKLTGIAENSINAEAAEAGDENEKEAPSRGRTRRATRGLRAVAADRTRRLTTDDRRLVTEDYFPRRSAAMNGSTTAGAFIVVPITTSRAETFGP